MNDESDKDALCWTDAGGKVGSLASPILGNVEEPETDAILQLSELHGRTGTEAVIIAVRSSEDHFNVPEFWASSRRAEDFVNMSLGVSINDIAPQFEAFVFSGLKGKPSPHAVAQYLLGYIGAANHYTESLQDWKKKCGKLIHEKLGMWRAMSC